MRHRDEIPVDEEVDLHGMAVDEALAAAALALERHRGKRGAVIRFIHGHSSGLSGSIKGAFKRNLDSVWKGRIAAHRPEPGNPGATLVRLP
jgi:DNA-nicking Smr family endonuclease